MAAQGVILDIMYIGDLEYSEITYSLTAHQRPKIVSQNERISRTSDILAG